MLGHELDQHLSPTVHVLGRVAAAEHDGGHAELDVAQRLAAQVEKVGEVRHAADVGRSTADLDPTRVLIGQQLIVEATLDQVGLNGLLDLSDTVLLTEVNGLEWGGVG